jgi:cold shock CspA family protein
MRATIQKCFATYAFAKPDTPGPEIFVHANDLVAGAMFFSTTIVPGARITCEVVPGRELHAPRAARVYVIDRDQPPQPRKSSRAPTKAERIRSRV